MATTVITKSSLNVVSGTSANFALSGTAVSTLLTVPAGQYAIYTLAINTTIPTPADLIVDIFNSLSGFDSIWSVWYKSASANWYTMDDKQAILGTELVVNTNSRYMVASSSTAFYAGPSQLIQARQSTTGGITVVISYTLFNNT